MKLPLGLGKLDWSEWLMGLGAAVIGGGATAAIAAVSFAPSHWANHPEELYSMLWSMFGIGCVLNGLMFIRQKPLPSVITTTTGQKLSSTPEGTSVTTVTKVKEEFKAPEPSSGE